MKRSFIILCMTVLLFPAIAFSTQITSVSSYQVYGSQLSGMAVTVNFVNGPTVNNIWGSNGVSGGSGNTAWSLSFLDPTETTDNFDTNWQLLVGTNAISSITIDAYGAYNFFDIYYNPATTGTLGSEQGWFSLLGNNPTVNSNSVSGSFSHNNSTYNYTFTDPVNLVNQAAVGDLWTTLTIDFGASGLSNSALAFAADTDIVSGHEVPEPATILLFGFGLLGLGAIGRKKA